ncbi:MAG: AGE family epimerase/isomerase [Planctomycetes bacterium]|nr:AGE family epimerase/isomerase [Planctomycetota bacterium]
MHQLRALYARTLLEDVIPFWQRHGLDPTGGINSCIQDDGLLVSRDRWGWSQWRAVWVFSHLYNAIEPRAAWLDSARAIHRFVSDHGPMTATPRQARGLSPSKTSCLGPEQDGHWPMLMDAEGRVQRGYESIFNDGFAIYGLVELWRASRDDALLEAAMRTFRIVQAGLAGPELPPIFPYPAPPEPTAQAHGLSMLFSHVFHELALATGDAEVRQAADVHHRRVMELFLRSDRGLLLEWLRADGGEFAPPRGTAVIPGHAIESMWFQMHIAREHNDMVALDRACEAIRRHLEIGWDQEYGGLFYAVDADGEAEVGWPFAEAKLWWPHAEALYATLLAYEHCRRDWCLEWHERLREWSYTHFPVPRHGEWYQKLDRRGQPFADVVALPVKDPFHLPRALMLCVECLDRLLE